MSKKLTILFLLFAAACTQTYDVPSVFQLNVMVKYPSEINNGDVIRGATVKVKDVQSEREYSDITDESGMATFEIRGGNYDIVTSVLEDRIMEEETKTFVFNGALNGHLLTAGNDEVVLQTGYTVLTSSFVIKELYVSGSRTPEGKNYKADLFVEIYNNSDIPLFSDGLCFGTVCPTVTTRPTPFVDSEGNLLPRIPCWGFIAVVPGSGDEYPVQPGKSIVMALTGINHRDDPNGNPNSIDLSKADWEFCVENNGYYADSPEVPNLLMQRVTGGVRAMIFDVKGQTSILFRLPSENYEELFTNPDNFMIEPGGSERAFMVPREWIIDGVENVRLDEIVYKRLPPEIDLGYIQHNGPGEKVSIRRKIKEVAAGRVIYLDTNNSSEDFLTNQEPQPGVISAY